MLIKGLVPGLIDTMGLAEFDAFLAELGIKARGYQEAIDHPGEGRARRVTPGEELGGPTPVGHNHLALARNPDRRGAMANAILIGKTAVDDAMNAAAGPNASASLFTAAKVTHLGWLPQGQPERALGALAMVARKDEEGFGNCTWHGECQAACPKSINILSIARMNRDWLRASLSVRQPDIDRA